MLKHLLVFLGMLGSLVWAGHRLYYGPAHYTHLSQVLAGTVEHQAHGPVPAASLDTKDHVVLYFAASWCAACQEVTPLLIRFYTTYASHQNFEILLVPADRSADALRAYVRRAAIPWASVPLASAPIVTTGAVVVWDRGDDGAGSPLAGWFVTGPRPLA